MSVPSLLLQEALEQTDQQQSGSLFLTPLLHAVKMLTGDPSPPLISGVMYYLARVKQRKHSFYWSDEMTHTTTMFQSHFQHCHCDIYLSSTGDWRHLSRLATIDRLLFIQLLYNFCEPIRIYIWIHALLFLDVSRLFMTKI